MLKLNVDATDLAHAIMSVHETVPVSGPGPLTLLYPRWLPGEHAPGGSIDKVAGLYIHAGGQKIEWKRDPVDVFAFHVNVPTGVSAVDVDFQFLSPVSTREGRVVMTQEMLNVEWNAVAMYPRRLLLSRREDPAEREAAGRLDAGDGAGGRVQDRRWGGLQDHHLQHPGGFAPDRRQVFQGL